MFLTQDDLIRRLHYDPKTGIFTWIDCSDPRRNGLVAGSLHPNGDVHISIDNKTYKAHRLAWLYMTGKWPPRFIDHKNGVRSDNRLSNLRLADDTQNCHNRKCRSDNRIGMKGVSFDPRSEKFQARIMVRGKSTSLGYFETPEAAHAAYLSAANDRFGEFSVSANRARA